MEELLKNFNSLEDFLLDDSFRKWIFTKESAAAISWNNWIVQHPGKQRLFNMAYHILENLYMKNQHISEEEVKREIGKILLKIKEDEFATPAAPKGKVINGRFKYWKATAAAVIILAAGIFFFTSKQDKAPDSYEAFIKKSTPGTKEYANNSDTTQVITLADSSTVTLYAKTRLVFTLGADKREVYMDGKAFFEVKKNAAQPFIVYTKKLVTKVLGTSFYIDAYPQQKVFSVVVKTGKVSVYKGEDFTEKAARPNELEGTLVTPNQKIVLESGKTNLVRSLVESPVIISPTPAAKFQFEATPVSQVFAQIEKEYGIHILYDETVFGACSLTAVFNNESFYDKLDIIVKAINATYELVDGNVVISSNGCK